MSTAAVQPGDPSRLKSSTSDAHPRPSPPIPQECLASLPCAGRSLLKRGSDYLAEKSKQVEWSRQLRDLDRRLRSSSAEDRPLALVYVQHAAHRLYPDKVAELIRRSHEMLVPTFLVIADKWAVGKPELATKQEEVSALIDEIGPNRRGKKVVALSLSSRPKPVGTTVHPEAGVPEFVSALLSMLDPADALTFIRSDSSWEKLARVLGKRRRPSEPAELPNPEGEEDGEQDEAR